MRRETGPIKHGLILIRKNKGIYAFTSSKFISLDWKRYVGRRAYVVVIVLELRLGQGRLGRGGPIDGHVTPINDHYFKP